MTRENATAMVTLHDGRVVPEQFVLRGSKDIASAWGISVKRFEQYAAEGRNKPARGVNLTPDLIPKNDRGRYCLPAGKAMRIYGSIIEPAMERPHVERDPVSGRITGKGEFGTRPSDLDPSIPKPRKPIPWSKKRKGKSEPGSPTKKSKKRSNRGQTK